MYLLLQESQNNLLVTPVTQNEISSRTTRHLPKFKSLCTAAGCIPRPALKSPARKVAYSLGLWEIYYQYGC